MGGSDATSTMAGGATTNNSGSSTPIDRVTLEIKGARLNVAIQNALRRRRTLHDRSSAPDNDRLNGNERSSRSVGEALHRAATRNGGEAALAKECALLKAAVESLRAGLREKEDAVTELEREKEILAEHAGRVDSVTQESVKQRQRVAELETQVEHLQSNLAEAEAGRALTMTLVDTLKSAQNDLRRAHGQVAQRCAELENTAEDSAEAVRRGDIILHSQQLKVDAQARQLKRQEGNLATLSQDRELQLTKADRAEAELAQVLRRERTGQAHIADAQAETEELKGELEHMKTAFARHRTVVRKNQEVIDSHEKALQDARSELLALSLEAEKQTARHQQAAIDAASETARVAGGKDTALRENRALRVENESLKDRLEESGRKLEEEAAVAAAVEKSTHSKKDAGQCEIRPSPRKDTAKPPSPMPGKQRSHPPSQEHPRNDIPHQQETSRSNVRQQARGQEEPLNNHRTLVQALMSHGSSSRDISSTGAAAQPKGSDSPTAFSRRSSDLLPATESSGTAGVSAQKSSRADGAANRTADVAVEGWMGTSNSHDCPSPLKSTADAGAGDAGGGDGAGGGGILCPLSRGNNGRKVTDATSIRDDHEETNVAKHHNSEDHDLEHHPTCTGCSRPHGEIEKRAYDGCPEDGGMEVENMGAGKARKIPKGDGQFARPRARKDGGSEDEGGADEFGKNNDEMVAFSRPGGARLSSPCRPSLSGSSRSTRSGRGGDKRVGPTRPRDSGAHPAEDSRRTSSMVLSTASPASDACPRCGDSPYGLMINCSGCGRQCHSSCVPEGQRVGKGLGAVFQCSNCISSS